MKKIIGLAVLGLVVWSLAGCGQTTVTQTENTTAVISALTFSGISSVAPIYEGEVNTRVIVSWEAAVSESPVTYSIYHATSESSVFSSTAIPTSGVTSCFVASLEPDTKYYFGIRATNESGSFETNTITKVATTGVVMGSMKQGYPYALGTYPIYKLIGIKAYLPPNSNGIAGLDTGGKPTSWFYVFNVNGTTEVYQAIQGVQATKISPGDVSNYNDIISNFSLNNSIPINYFIEGLDSYALMKIANNDPTVEAWITAHPSYNSSGITIVIYFYHPTGPGTYSTLFTVSLDAGDGGATQPKPINIDASTGAVSYPTE